MIRQEQSDLDTLVPLIGKDEMNLIEFPFGPISQSGGKTMQVEHETYDPMLKRRVRRSLLITGSDAFGLPRPIDDQVLVGMKALTHEAGYESPRVEFSRYQLCRTIGWETDGRAYRRLEESLDRIAGTLLKFKDAWWAKGEAEWMSKTFHLIQEVELCSRDRLDRARLKTGDSRQRLCSFTWTDVIWKSLRDGYIKTLDMELFRRIGGGRRREVPLRLFRILDKRFWHASIAEFELHRLGVGTLGLCPKYSPSQVRRIIDRAAHWLIACDYLEGFWYGTGRRGSMVYFKKRTKKRRVAMAAVTPLDAALESDELKHWLRMQTEQKLSAAESQAMEQQFGSELERRLIHSERVKGRPILTSGRIRLEFVRRYLATQSNA